MEPLQPAHARGMHVSIEALVVDRHLPCSLSSITISGVLSTMSVNILVSCGKILTINFREVIEFILLLLFIYFNHLYN
jgi:hypothetical protein